jgi:hypothetical protein
MAFVVEDGTGKIDANSYVTVAYANLYFAERGLTVWDNYFDDAKQSALILATDYIEMRYASKVSGDKLFPDTPQALSFPRKDSSTGITINSQGIERATCEYAYRAIQGTLVKDVASDAAVSTRIKVGSIEKETNFAPNSQRNDMFASYPTADLLMKPYLKSNSGYLVRQ